jgi:hypothetical protein
MYGSKRVRNICFKGREKGCYKRFKKSVTKESETNADRGRGKLTEGQ